MKDPSAEEIVYNFTLQKYHPLGQVSAALHIIEDLYSRANDKERGCLDVALREIDNFDTLYRARVFPFPGRSKK